MKFSNGSVLVLAAALVGLEQLAAGRALDSHLIVAGNHWLSSHLSYLSTRGDNAFSDVGLNSDDGKGTKEKVKERSNVNKVLQGTINRSEEAPSILGAGRIGGVREPMTEYMLIGMRRAMDLETVINRKVPDSTTTEDPSQVQIKGRTESSVFYDIFGGEDDNPYIAYENELDDITIDPSRWQLELFQDPLLPHINWGTKGTEITIRNYDNEFGELMRTIVRGIYDPNGEFVVALEGFKENDYAEKTSTRTPVNEMSWQSFKAIAGDKVKNLKAIYLWDIQNNGFQSILEEAHKATGKRIDEPAVWSKNDLETKQWFYKLMGTDNVNGKVTQITNHHNAVGEKTVAKIITMAKQVPNPMDAVASEWNKDPNRSLTAVVVLEKKSGVLGS